MYHLNRPAASVEWDDQSIVGVFTGLVDGPSEI